MGPHKQNARNLHNPFPSLRKWVLQDYKFSNSVHDTQIKVIRLEDAAEGLCYLRKFFTQVSKVVFLKPELDISHLPATEWNNLSCSHNNTKFMHVQASSGSSLTVRRYSFSSMASEAVFAYRRMVSLKYGQNSWKHHKWTCFLIDTSLRSTAVIVCFAEGPVVS